MSLSVAAVSSSSPSLFIPHEILGEILSYCNVDTLAAVSRVSSACLELASPFLVTDVALRDLESIIKLFRLSPSFGDALPKSDRVTSHTSLSLIHSITVHLEDNPLGFSPLSSLPLPSPLALPVLVVSLPGPDSAVSPHHYDICAFVRLVNPRQLIVQGRQPKLNSVRFRPHAVNLVRSNHPANSKGWSRLSLVLLAGASVEFDELLDLSLGSADLAPPLRVVVDLIGASETDFATSEHANFFLAEDEDNSYFRLNKFVSLKALVGCEGVKKALEEKMKESDQHYVPLSRRQHADVLIASNRALRFRKYLTLGARKWMDWAVLDEM